MSSRTWPYLASSLLALALVTPPASAQRSSFLGKTLEQWRAGLDASEAAARRSAAYALGKLGRYADGELPELLKLLKADPDASVREAAAFAVGEIFQQSRNSVGNEEAIATLTATLRQDKEALVRRSAAFALGCLGRFAEDALPDLDRALKDNDPAVRQNVAWALGRLGVSSVASLRKALRDDDPLVLRDAAGALGELQRSTRDLNGLPTVDAQPAVPELLRHCGHPDPGVKKAVFAALVRLVGPEQAGSAVPPLTRALQDADLEVRRNAALALGNVGGDEAAAAVPVLLDALQKGELETKRQAAAAIRNIGPAAKGAVPLLRKVLRQDDVELRRNAAVALGGIAQEARDAVPDLVDHLIDRQEDDLVRMEAAVALSRVGTCPEALAAIPKLVKVLADPDNHAQVRAKTLWALRTHGLALAEVDELFPALEKVLGEPKTETNRLLRYDCAFLLGVFKQDKVSDRAMDTLQEFLEDKTIIIYTGTQTKVTGTAAEKGGGTANVQESGKGDGRVMAVDALRAIGARRINQRPEMVRQLRSIANDPATVPDLKDKTRELIGML